MSNRVIVSISWYSCLVSLPIRAQPAPGTLKWSIDLAGPISGSPALGSDGTLYVCADALYAITNTGQSGSSKWVLPVGGFQPAIGSDGTIYLNGSDTLYAVNPNGTLRWSLTITNDGYKVSYVSSPALGFDGTIYVAAAGRLRAITNGVEMRNLVVDDTQDSYDSPVVGRDGTVYYGSTQTSVLSAVSTKHGRVVGLLPDWKLRCPFEVETLSGSVVVHYDKAPVTGGDYGPVFMADNMRITPAPPPIVLGQAQKLANGAFQFAFTNTPGTGFTVLTTTNPGLAAASWVSLGAATEISSGQYQFTDLDATNHGARFYRVSSP